MSRAAPPADTATVAQLTQPRPARTRPPGPELTTGGHPRLHGPLRHVVVSLLMELGVPPHVVQAIAGTAT